MKILVTGGNGFIGSYLVEALIELGHEIVILSNEENDKNPKATFIKGDIRDAYDVRKAMDGCGLVYHLAALSDLRNANDDDVYAVNFLGAKNVFEVAKQKNAKVIFASSAAVYGNSQVPNKETSECKPVSQYGKSKLRAERYLQALVPEHFIVRLFNVYGPKGHSFINTLCKKMPNFEDIIVYGNGMQTRDYVYVTDVVNALLLGINNTGLYNVGTGQDYAVVKLVDTIHEITRCKPSIKFTLPQANEIARSRADITKITELRWQPTTTLEEGLKAVLEASGWKRM